MARFRAFASLTPALAALITPLAAGASPDRESVLHAMKRATAFMVDEVSCEGGYVWSYLPDLSRRWGEMEAGPTMIWIQAPGTPAMGEMFLNAFEATGDAFYHRAAERAAEALMRAQHPAGGWNYAADMAGEESLRQWYRTIGRNGWRLEEFHYYYGNATFDDSTTADAARFLLRIFLAKRDEKFRAPVDRAIEFVLDSQYPVGGWPQRFPLMGGFSKQGNPDYTGYITFNDDVAAQNIDLLIKCEAAFGGARLREAIERAMHSCLVAQQPAPQAGWALQYTPDDMQPAGARTYEPRALATHATAACIEQLLAFHARTGDRKFLARIPEALDWLDSVKLPPGIAEDRGTHPTFVEIGTNRPLFIHRSGSNATNGRYFANHDPENTTGHYSSFRFIPADALRERYREAASATGANGSESSAVPPQTTSPRHIDPRADSGDVAGLRERAAGIVAALNAEGWWPAPLRMTSHPYKGDGPAEPAPGDFSRTQVGDEYDTSPFPDPTPATGISVRTYLENMRILIRHLEDLGTTRP